MLFPCALPFSSSSPKVSVPKPVSATGKETFRCWGVGVVAQSRVGSLAWGVQAQKQDQGQEVGGAGEEGEQGRCPGRKKEHGEMGSCINTRVHSWRNPEVLRVNEGTGHSLAGVRKHRQTSLFPGAHWRSPPGSFLGCSGHTLSPGKNFQDIFNESGCWQCVGRNV